MKRSVKELRRRTGNPFKGMPSTNELVNHICQCADSEYKSAVAAGAITSSSKSTDVLMAFVYPSVRDFLLEDHSNHAKKIKAELGIRHTTLFSAIRKQLTANTAHEHLNKSAITLEGEKVIKAIDKPGGTDPIKSLS